MISIFAKYFFVVIIVAVMSLPIAVPFAQLIKPDIFIRKRKDLAIVCWGITLWNVIFLFFLPMGGGMPRYEAIIPIFIVGATFFFLAWQFMANKLKIIPIQDSKIAVGLILLIMINLSGLLACFF